MFVLYDMNSKIIYASRDPFGVRPGFIGYNEEELLNNPRIVLGDNSKIAGYIISVTNILDKSSCGLAMIKNAYLDYPIDIVGYYF